MQRTLDQLQNQGFPPGVVAEFISRNVDKNGAVSKTAPKEAKELFGIDFVYSEDEIVTLPTKPSPEKPIPKPPLSDSLDHHGYEVGDAQPMYYWVPCVQFCGVLIYYTTFFSIIAFTVLALMYLLSQEIFWYQRVTA